MVVGDLTRNLPGISLILGACISRLDDKLWLAVKHSSHNSDIINQEMEEVTGVWNGRRWINGDEGAHVIGTQSECTNYAAFNMTCLEYRGTWHLWTRQFLTLSAFLPIVLLQEFPLGGTKSSCWGSVLRSPCTWISLHFSRNKTERTHQLQ